MQADTFSISVPCTPAGAIMLDAAAKAMAGSFSQARTASPAAAASQAAAPAAAAPMKGKPGRKSNAEKAMMAAAAAQQQQGASAAGDDDLDLGGEDDGDDELGLGDDTPPAKALTLNGDVIPAFRDALARVGGDKSKLAKVLEGYGVKSVQNLPETSFGAVIAQLAKLK